jgi:orotidine-5'-phosphate decarboxylase
LRQKLIIALDVDTEAEALGLVRELSGLAVLYKVGLQLYNNTGPGIVGRLTGSGVKVFLDLKFHDIPNTAARAAEAVAGLGAFMLNMHAAGGQKMLAEASAAARARARALGGAVPLIVGVTVLTSMSEAELKQELGVSRPLPEQVAALAQLCRKAGLDGVVASAREIPWIRRACGPDFVIVTPGVRPAWSARNDQERIVTPGEALKLGADYVVVGRPVTAAADPRQALARLLTETGDV